MRKKVAFISGLVVLLLLGAYLAIGFVIYDKLARVTPGGGVNAPYTPASFKPYKEWPQFDVSPYLMSEYESVHFPSRQPGLTLRGWYVPGKAGMPLVIVVHGLNGCKCDPNVLTAAGMLHRNGFNVLLFDLREHGESDIEDGRSAIGNEEYLDVLGAWDWAIREKGYPAQKIGVYAVSLGAGTTLIAFGREPRLAAAFVDSPYADLDQIIKEELTRNGYPTFLEPGSLLMAKLVSGDDLLAYSPKLAIQNDAGRPIFIVHGTGDQRINIHHTRDLVALAEQTGANVTAWMPEGEGHVATEFDQPDEYEQRLTDFFLEALSR